MNSSGPLYPVTCPLHRHRFTLALAGAIAAAAPLAAQRGSPQPFPNEINGAVPAFVPARPVVICFPPTPPPLDRPFSHLANPTPQRLTPPPELATYVNEPFYAPLSTWIIEKALTDKTRQRLAVLRAGEAAVLAELRAALEQSRAVEPAARLHALEALARLQTPRLQALEQEAEQIRAELATSHYDWRAVREWSLGEKNTRGDSPFEIAAVMRACAFYQAGLTPPQRRLLREISLELSMAAENTTAAQEAQPFLFFPPEPARVMLREDLPDDVAAAVASYQTKKSALKKELFDTVYKQDSASFSFSRNSALKALADRQAPQLAELEKLAEEIRRGLAKAPAAPVAPAERSPLPPVLTARVGEVLLARTALQKDAVTRAEAIRERHAAVPAQISYGFDTESLKYLVVPRRSPDNRTAEELREKIRAIEAEFAVVAEDFSRRFTELVHDTDTIRHDAAVALGKPEKSREVENAISGATRAVALRESEDAYREYRTAVFEPGMSPEQRRLLFGFALEKLDLPLPRGELQPVRRASTW